jgi:hypothetical protein
MFVFYIIPFVVFALLYKKGEIDKKILLLLVSTLLCTWAAEVSVADGFIRDGGSTELINDYESYAFPGVAIIVGLVSVAVFIYSSVSLLRSKK